MPGYLARLIRSGARHVAPPPRRAMPSGAQPMRVTPPEMTPSIRGAATPTATPPAHVGALTPMPADPLTEPSRRAIPIAQRVEYTPAPVREPAGSPVASEALDMAAEEPAPVDAGTARAEAPRGPGDVPPLPVAATVVSIPPVKHPSMPLPRIEFSSSVVPIPDRRSLRPAPIVSGGPRSEPAPASELARPSSERPGGDGRPASLPSPTAPPSPERSVAPRAPEVTEVRPTAARRVQASVPAVPAAPSPSLERVRPPEVIVREDFRHRPLHTTPAGEPRLSIQRLDVQIINEPPPIKRRPERPRIPAHSSAEHDALRLNRRHARRLL